MHDLANVSQEAQQTRFVMLYMINRDVHITIMSSLRLRAGDWWRCQWITFWTLTTVWLSKKCICTIQWYANK